VGTRWAVTKRSNRADRLDPLLRDALAWVVLLKSGEATVADAEQLIDWRTRSPAHERAFRDAVKCWWTIGQSLANAPPSRQARRRKTKGTSAS
jgi:transmembrane sensor